MPLAAGNPAYHAAGPHQKPRLPNSLTEPKAAGKHRRISSLTPVAVRMGAFIMGVMLSLGAIFNGFAQPAITVLLLILATAHLGIGVVLTIAVKTVAFNGRCYRITGLCTYEEITPADLCLVVEARGVLWNTIRLHFKRPTRFGYDIAFVPAASHKDSASLAALLRALRTPENLSGPFDAQD